MNVFDAYARYYDLLNRDKDYVAEARYVASLLGKYGGGNASLLDIGCGTGRHAEQFADMGLEVVGLDRSEEMISRASARCPELDFHTGDICTFRLGKQFDVISALFHVVSYLTTDGQLGQAFANVRRHLNAPGLFVFDCWHGPAVVHQGPEIRIRRIAEGDTRVVRIAEPMTFPEMRKVDVHYQVFVRQGGAWQEFSEVHAMRYLFREELEELLADNGMRLLHEQEWLTMRSPSKNSWSVVYVAGLK